MQCCVMRILAIDYGAKRMGLAVSDPLGITAQGIPALLRSTQIEDVKRLLSLINEKGVEEVVIGLPKNMNNTLGEKATEVIEFIEILKKYISIPIYTFDERLTTVMGNKAMLEGNLSRKKRKDKIDTIAAQLILQGYIDSRKND